MKIRTDFVTNSSSSSFITIIVHTKDGHIYRGEYDSGNNSMMGDADFFVDTDFFASIKNCGELVDEAKAWFDANFTDSSLPAEYDYSDGEIDIIRNVPMSNVKIIEISSMIDYEEYAFGSNICYNHKTKKLRVEDTGYGDDYDEFDEDELDDEYDDEYDEECDDDEEDYGDEYNDN